MFTATSAVEAQLFRWYLQMFLDIIKKHSSKLKIISNQIQEFFLASLKVLAAESNGIRAFWDIADEGGLIRRGTCSVFHLNSSEISMSIEKGKKSLRRSTIPGFHDTNETYNAHKWKPHTIRRRIFEKSEEKSLELYLSFDFITVKIFYYNYVSMHVAKDIKMTFCQSCVNHAAQIYCVWTEKNEFIKTENTFGNK